MQYLHHICSPCAQHMCWPCAQQICKPYVAAYLQVAAPVLYSCDAFTLCDTFVRPVRHICKLCIIFAGLMQHICRPCAAYLQAAPYSQAVLCMRVLGPVAYLQAQALCIILAGPVPVQHMHTLCSIFAAHCASYLHLPCRPCGISIILAGCFTS